MCFYCISTKRSRSYITVYFLLEKSTVVIPWYRDSNTIVLLYIYLYIYHAFKDYHVYTKQERSQKGDSGCATEKLGVPH